MVRVLVVVGVCTVLVVVGRWIRGSRARFLVDQVTFDVVEDDGVVEELGVSFPYDWERER